MKHIRFFDSLRSLRMTALTLVSSSRACRGIYTDTPKIPSLCSALSGSANAQDDTGEFWTTSSRACRHIDTRKLVFVSGKRACERSESQGSTIKNPPRKGAEKIPKMAKERHRVCNFYIFSHSDYTAGFGISPNLPPRCYNVHLSARGLYRR